MNVFLKTSYVEGGEWHPFWSLGWLISILAPCQKPSSLQLNGDTPSSKATEIGRFRRSSFWKINLMIAEKLQGYDALWPTALWPKVGQKYSDYSNIEERIWRSITLCGQKLATNRFWPTFLGKKLSRKHPTPVVTVKKLYTKARTVKVFGGSPKPKLWHEKVSRGNVISSFYLSCSLFSTNTFGQIPRKATLSQLQSNSPENFLPLCVAYEITPAGAEICTKNRKWLDRGRETKCLRD